MNNLPLLPQKFENPLIKSSLERTPSLSLSSLKNVSLKALFILRTCQEISYV